MELSPNEKMLIDKIREAGPYTKIEIVKRPTMADKKGEIVLVTVMETMRIEFGTQISQKT